MIITGFMGAGKSYVGELLRAQGVRVLDTDQLIEGRHGSISKLFEKGEGYFRAIEIGTVKTALPEAEVLVLGGGAILSPEIQALIKGRPVAYLKVDPKTAYERVRGAKPLAKDYSSFLKLYQERLETYESLADLIATSQNFLKAYQLFKGLPQGSKLRWVEQASGEYPVIFKPGLLPDFLYPEGAKLVVKDRKAPALFEPDFEIEGEANKSLKKLEELALALSEREVNFLVAYGGGVVGDLTGFLAATYRRGVPYIQVPTTLTAQVDSAYGAKVGVNLKALKNYLGAYYPPSSVLTDPKLLESLPQPEFANGYVELVKAALLKGGKFWEMAKNGSFDSGMIWQALNYKLDLVELDERDQGLRRLLNLGHTLGHALESLSGYRLSHGAAVGLGLLWVLRATGHQQLYQEVKELFEKQGLPVGIRGFEFEEIMGVAQKDKKSLNSELKFVVLRFPGQAEFDQQISRNSLKKAFQDLEL